VVYWAGCSNARSDIQLHALIIEHCARNILKPIISFIIMSIHSIDTSLLWRDPSVFLEEAAHETRAGHLKVKFPGDAITDSSRIFPSSWREYYEGGGVSNPSATSEPFHQFVF
jgi:hypothetical protein